MHGRVPSQHASSQTRGIGHPNGWPLGVFDDARVGLHPDRVRLTDGQAASPGARRLLSSAAAGRQGSCW